MGRNNTVNYAEMRNASLEAGRARHHGGQSAISATHDGLPCKQRDCKSDLALHHLTSPTCAAVSNNLMCGRLLCEIHNFGLSNDGTYTRRQRVLQVTMDMSPWRYCDILQ